MCEATYYNDPQSWSSLCKCALVDKLCGTNITLQHTIDKNEHLQVSQKPGSYDQSCYVALQLGDSLAQWMQYLWFQLIFILIHLEAGPPE